MQAPADSPAWDDAVVAAYGLERRTVTTADATLRLFRARHGRAWSNAPYLEYGGADWAPDRPGADTLSELLRLAAGPRTRYVLIKSLQELAADNAILHIDRRYVTFRLDLSAGPEALWRDALNGKTRNQVRKAERQGFAVATGGAELLNDFYRVISQVWRDLGTPVHSPGFFREIVRAFGEACRFHVIYADDLPVAAALLLVINDVVQHPFAGTVAARKPGSVNNLLVWNIIRDACERGLTAFDMGRSATSAGTYRYKRSWGAEPVPLYYHYLLAPGAGPPERDSRLMQICTGAWRYLPLPLANSLGPHLIRYVL